jgi:hypothetical protein
VLDLEDLLTTRWENAAAIQAYAPLPRPGGNPARDGPAGFTATLRPYQQQGVDWLQHLRAHGLGGFLADDMGLGKTAQTIAHIVIEQAAGRLDRPALIVVPTSLVTNWTAELAKFAPHLRVAVLHGLDRHARRAELAGIHVVITTYTVLARDIEAMKLLPGIWWCWTRRRRSKAPTPRPPSAVCQLDTTPPAVPVRHADREQFAGALVQFAFLMPGLLGDRPGFAKRFRTPIEKNNDAVRRRAADPPHQTVHAAPHEIRGRDRPAARNTRSCAASPWPRNSANLYETIRATLHDKVREQHRRTQCRAEPHRRARRAAQAAPGLLRPATGQAAVGPRGWWRPPASSTICWR